MALERLDKVLASTGRWSRKEVKELIRRGRVLVDGVAARGPQAPCDPERAQIQVDGQALSCPRFVYLMMHKPAGLLSATRDKAQATVLDLLPPDLRRRGLFPAGRLDKETTGLLLLTDDGGLAHSLLSPKKGVDKVYHAGVSGLIQPEDVAALAAGIVLGDGLHCLPATLEPLNRGEECLLTLQEGKFHQVKRMLAACGKPVHTLHRRSIGPLHLDPALEPGAWRPLRNAELTALMESLGLKK